MHRRRLTDMELTKSQIQEAGFVRADAKVYEHVQVSHGRHVHDRPVCRLSSCGCNGLVHGCAAATDHASVLCGSGHRPALDQSQRQTLRGIGSQLHLMLLTCPSMPFAGLQGRCSGSHGGPHGPERRHGGGSSRRQSAAFGCWPQGARPGQPWHGSPDTAQARRCNRSQ